MKKTKSHVLTGLLLLCGAFSVDQANAQWIVNDPPHTVKTVLGWIESHKQDLKEIQQWRNQINHYTQQLTTLAKFMDQPMLMSDDFKERPADYNMAAECPGSSGGLSISSLWSSFTLDPQGDIRAQQLELCQRIVLAKNARYNEQVRMLKRIRDNSAQLQQLASARSSVGQSQGALAANDNDVSRLMARAENDMQYTQTALMAYDGYIVSLKENQTLLANQALSGKTETGPFSQLMGTIVQGAALKGALEVARQRDR